MTDEQILNALRRHPDGFVSGEQLSQQLGVSRTAIWKGIEKLRELGYEIAAQSHEGYQLISAPDRLIPEELQWQLQTDCVGKAIHAYQETDSTMDIAHRLGADGAADGTVVVAEAQRAGRGRLGRVWTSEQGIGIYTSILLRPACDIQQIPFVTLMAAVAVSEAIAQLGLRPQIKWPNDILIEGAKVSGILTELHAEMDRVHYCILGIGLNVNSQPNQLPPEGTSLALASGQHVDRIAFARCLLQCIDQAYAQFKTGQTDQLLDQWRQYASFLGQQIRIQLQGKVIEGQAQDIDPTGALLVRTDQGFLETIRAGDVFLSR